MVIFNIASIRLPDKEIGKATAVARAVARVVVVGSSFLNNY